MTPNTALLSALVAAMVSALLVHQPAEAQAASARLTGETVTVVVRHSEANGTPRKVRRAKVRQHRGWHKYAVFDPWFYGQRIRHGDCRAYVHILLRQGLRPHDTDFSCPWAYAERRSSYFRPSALAERGWRGPDRGGWRHGAGRIR